MRGRRGTRSSSTTRRSGERKSKSRRGTKPQAGLPAPRLTPGVSEPEYAESIGSTLEDAIEKALDVLGARDDEVDVEILEEGKRGFLGFGIRRPFRVRVSWREDNTQEIVVDKDPPKPTSPPLESRQPKARPSDRPDRAKGPGRSSRSGGSRSAPADIPQPVPVEGLDSIARDAVNELLGLMGLDADVRVVETPEGVLCELDSPDDEGLLIGKRGETRAALQHILHRILSRRAGQAITVQVDVGGYWDRRVEELREEAQQLAARALESDHSMETDFLSPQERRIIHRELEDNDSVRTESLGRGLHKKVAVTPITYSRQ